MVQNRFETKAGIYDPVSFLKNINARVAYTDYEHVELEAGTPSTRFTNRGIEARLEAVQQQIGGWDGRRSLRSGYRHQEHRPVRAAGKAVRPVQAGTGRSPRPGQAGPDR
ncbi:hypothetical protein G6F40_017578 [Rhizopus arrhizus]|nr:hypothetical protein G6F40_017578 [Rhizopus arrhizus]